jgi:hypothetical protein
MILPSTTACTRATTVPKTEWEELEEVDNGDYRIRTYDGQEYATGRFTRTDSTVVIYEVFREGKRLEVNPIVIPAKDIESVKKVRLWRTGTAIFVVSVVTVAAGVFILGYLAFGGESLD